MLINLKPSPTSVVGAYQPTGKEAEFLSLFHRDYQTAYQIMSKPHPEFGRLTLTQKIEQCQKSFAQLVDLQFPPSQAWRSKAFRSIVREKIVTIAAHVSSNPVWPAANSYNQSNDYSRNYSMVMSDLLFYIAKEAKYDEKYVEMVIGGMVNPIFIWKTQYQEVYRTIKNKALDGKITTKKILDDLLSGCKLQSVMPSEFFIGNFNEPDVQAQPFLIERQVIPYETAKQLFSSHPNFRYVQPGVQYTLANFDQQLFPLFDIDLVGRYVERNTYYNRFLDLQVDVINGVVVSDPEEPNPRADKKYPYVTMGYEPIDGAKCFYHKSLADKLSHDEKLLNTLYRMNADSTALRVFPTAVITGSSQEITSDIIVPGGILQLTGDNPNTSFQTINHNTDLDAGLRMQDVVEASARNSSVDSLQAGIKPNETSTAFEIQQVEANANKMMGLYGQMIGNAAVDLGELWISDILQYYTTGKPASETEDGYPGQAATSELLYRQFLIEPQNPTGKPKKIELTMDIPDVMTKDDVLNRSMDIYDRELKTGMSIKQARPDILRSKFKHRAYVTYEGIGARSKAVDKAERLRIYEMFVSNPIINQPELAKVGLSAFDWARDNMDKLIQTPENPLMAPAPQPEMPGISNTTNPANSIASEMNNIAGDRPKTQSYFN